MTCHVEKQYVLKRQTYVLKRKTYVLKPHAARLKANRNNSVFSVREINLQSIKVKGVQ